MYGIQFLSYRSYSVGSEKLRGEGLEEKDFKKYVCRIVLSMGYRM